MTAAYRLFDNEKATLERILAPHREATSQRVGRELVVLCVQDTTEVDVTQPVLFTHRIQVRGRKAKVTCETRGRRQPRESRRAGTEMEVRAARVTLHPPNASSGSRCEPRACETPAEAFTWVTPSWHTGDCPLYAVPYMLYECHMNRIGATPANESLFLSHLLLDTERDGRPETLPVSQGLVFVPLP